VVRHSCAVEVVEHDLDDVGSRRRELDPIVDEWGKRPLNRRRALEQLSQGAQNLLFLGTRHPWAVSNRGSARHRQAVDNRAAAASLPMVAVVSVCLRPYCDRTTKSG
jgi:hypothetical protein